MGEERVGGGRQDLPRRWAAGERGGFVSKLNRQSDTVANKRIWFRGNVQLIGLKHASSSRIGAGISPAICWMVAAREEGGRRDTWCCRDAVSWCKGRAALGGG